MSSAASEKDSPQHAPGQELRMAREAAGISLEDLADRTLISPYRLEALERDDYDAVGGAAYVKGYARACARQLQLNPNNIVQAFEEKLAASRQQQPDHMAPGHRRPVAPVEFGDVGEGSPLRTLISGVLALIILGLFLAVLFGDTGRQESGIERDKVDSVISEPAHDGQSFSVPVPDLEVPQRENLQEDALESPDEQITAGSLPDSSPQEGAVTPQTPEAELGQTPAASSGISGSNPSTPSSLPDQTSPVTGSEAASAPLTDATDTLIRQLELSFTEPCWVQVTDANGEHIIAREAQSGDNLRLSGLAPLVVVLGNAPAASVKLDGEQVTIRPRAGTNVLRLKLGAQ